MYIPYGLFGEDFTYVFQGSGLESITFAPTITVIPEGICFDCKSLTEINWSDAPEIIRQRAFDACTALKDAKLPDSITTIEHAAFYGTGLETLHIPESLTTLGDRAFMNTNSLKQLYVPFDIEQSEPAFMGSGIERLEFADGIEYIRGTYQELPELTQVIIPESVKTIGAKAFYGDKSLPEIKLPSGLEEIGSDAFAGTEELYSITIPKAVTKCGWTVFTGSRLTDVTFEDGMEAIPENICRRAQWLETAHIPASVKKICGGAFSECRNLTTLDMPQDEISFAPDTFYLCDVLFDERVDIYSKADTLINRIETSRGQNGLINYTVYYKVNPRFEKKMTEGSVEIWVEDSNPIVCASLTEGLRSSPAAETQTHFSAPFNSLDKESIIRFSTRRKADANTAVTANFRLKMENEFVNNFYEKSISLSGEKLEKVSLKAPSAVEVKDGKVSFGVYGYAPADSEVTLFVNDNEVARVFPSRYTGRYTAKISADAEDGAEIKVYAMSGDTKSATQVLKCMEDVILVEKVMLYHDTSLTSYGLDITKIFT
ncbi:MAG: leucine-rich repeat domain-containing protein, partial [Ruminococcus sp.]|nr:leucine-rich repeat domain-containing protein [Ruminococcus sp.]